MEAHLTMWLGLLIRWAHFIFGIAWIGASFYFNWLENHLQRQQRPDGIAGDLWAMHGGGFYYLKKYAVAPKQLPPALHWFKWEAYWTWLSGMALLIIVFYLNAQTYMLKPGGTGITPVIAVSIGVGSLLASWVFYDLLCRSAEGDHVAVEIKRRGEMDGVEQLTRYLDRMSNDSRLHPLRGIFAAQLIAPQAKVLAEARGIKCVEVDYDDLRGTPSNELRLF